MNYPHKEKERMRHHKQLRLLSKICDHIPRISSEALTKVRQLRHLVLYANYLQKFLNIVTKGSCNIKATKNLLKDIKGTKSVCETFKVVKMNSHDRKTPKAHIVFLHSAKSTKSNSATDLKMYDIQSKYKDAVSLTSEYKQPEALPIDYQIDTNSSFELPYILNSTSMFPINQVCNEYKINSCSAEFICSDKENCQPISFESLENTAKSIKYQEETQEDNFHKLTNDSNNDYILKDITFSKMNDDFNHISANAFIRNEGYFSNRFETFPMQHNSLLYTSYCNSLDKYAYQHCDLSPSMCYANGIPVAPVYVNHIISSPENDSDNKSRSSTLTNKRNIDVENLSNSNPSFTNDNVDFPTSKCDTSDFSLYSYISKTNLVKKDSIISPPLNYDLQSNKYYKTSDSNTIRSIKHEPDEKISNYYNPHLDTYSKLESNTAENKIYSSMYNMPQSYYESFYPTSYSDFDNTMASPSIYSISDKMIHSMTNIRDVDTVFPLLNDNFQTKILYGDSDCGKIMLNNPSHSFADDGIEPYLPEEEISCSLADYFNNI